MSEGIFKALIGILGHATIQVIADSLSKDVSREHTWRNGAFWEPQGRCLDISLCLLVSIVRVFRKSKQLPKSNASTPDPVSVLVAS